jgi:phosphodiesterase/alkaline phosphatase D-like protein
VRRAVGVAGASQARLPRLFTSTAQALAICRPYYGPMIPFNPHIRFFDGDRRGSMTARLSRRAMEVDWRIADRVGDPGARVRTLRRFAVESGRPGLAQY